MVTPALNIYSAIKLSVCELNENLMNQIKVDINQYLQLLRTCTHFMIALCMHANDIIYVTDLV